MNMHEKLENVDGFRVGGYGLLILTISPDVAKHARSSAVSIQLYSREAELTEISLSHEIK